MDDELPSEMESKQGRPLAPLFRYCPYSPGWFGRIEMKEEAVQLGVKLSVSLAESMFLLCDDLRTMLCFCLKLWRVAEEHRYINPVCPVVERLLRVMHYVYSKDIKPKNGVFHNGGKSLQWGLISTINMDFADGFITLHRLVFFLTKRRYFDDRQLSLAIAKCKQVLKKLQDKLRSAEDVSKANGFSRETIGSNIFYLWKSLFDEEASQPTPKVMKNMLISDLFQPCLDEATRMASGLPIYSPDILGRGFAKQELKEEVVRFGVELSLYVAQSMFFLCDDTRGMLLFGFKLWRDAIRNRNRNHDSPVLERLLLVIHYVYSADIKPKTGVFQYGGRLAHQWRLIRATLDNFSDGIEGLDDLVLILRGEGSYLNCPELRSSIEQVLKKLEETLWGAMAVSLANGFATEMMKPHIWDLWKSVFDKEPKEATQTMKVIKNGILRDMFLPLWNEVAPPP